MGVSGGSIVIEKHYVSVILHYSDIVVLWPCNTVLQCFFSGVTFSYCRRATLSRSRAVIQ